MLRKLRKMLQQLDLEDKEIPFWDEYYTYCCTFPKKPNFKDYIYWLWKRYKGWRHLVKTCVYFGSFSMYMQDKYWQTCHLFMG